MAVHWVGSIYRGRGGGASGAAATWPGPLLPRPLLLGAMIHSLLRPRGPLPGQTAGKAAGCAVSSNPRSASRSAPRRTPAHAMADSERLSAPGCWAACTNLLRIRKGILLFAEIVSVPGQAGGQKRSGVAGSRGARRPSVRQARGRRCWSVGPGWVG